jgi:hypothetical protein
VFAAVATLSALLVLPGLVSAQEAEGFDGYIQSGTCDQPTDDVRVQLESDGDHDVEPYLAQDPAGEGTTTLGYYGSPTAPGFGVSVIYTGEPFSLVIADTEDDPVACGDLLEPDAYRFTEVGMALVQLLPSEGSTVHGLAVLQRTQLERELDVTPTRVRILLSKSEMPAADEVMEGFDGYVQAGSCESPSDRLRLQLQTTDDDTAVVPYLAKVEEGGEPATLAYYGAPLVPGYGVATAYTDQRFSLVITGSDEGDPVACGDILRPDSEDFTDAGLALVRLEPTGDEGVDGYALLERIPLQRELDVTPTRARIVIFAPPVSD